MTGSPWKAYKQAMTIPRKPFIAALIVTMAAGGLSVLDVNHATASIDESWLVNTVQNHEQRISGLESQVGKNSTDIAGLQANQPTSTTTTVVEQPTVAGAATTPTPVWTPSATPVPTPAATPVPKTIVSRTPCNVPGQKNVTGEIVTYSDGSQALGDEISIGGNIPGAPDCPNR